MCNPMKPEAPEIKTVVDILKIDVLYRNDFETSISLGFISSSSQQHPLACCHFAATTFKTTNDLIAIQCLLETCIKTSGFLGPPIRDR